MFCSNRRVRLSSCVAYAVLSTSGRSRSILPRIPAPDFCGTDSHAAHETRPLCLIFVCRVFSRLGFPTPSFPTPLSTPSFPTVSDATFPLFDATFPNFLRASACVRAIASAPTQHPRLLPSLLLLREVTEEEEAGDDGKGFRQVV
eukprot:2300607-Rhodomonas_salina.1